MDLLAALFPFAIAAILLVGVVAARHRILAVMAFRNVLRRPRQSVLIVFGLLVGTAIISGALVAGDSMGYAIVEATYDAFQEIDETVFIDGYNFFPQSVATDLAADRPLSYAVDGIGSNILWDGAVTDLQSRQYEPSVRLVGFDPSRDLVFGPFTHGRERFTGETLATDEVVLHKDVAAQLRASVGDRLTLNFTRPFDPILPRITTYRGHVDVTGGVESPLGGPPLYPPVPDPVQQNFTLGGSVVGLSVVLAWDPGPAGQDLDLSLLRPSGTPLEIYNSNGTAGAPDVPAILNLTGSVAHPVPYGTYRANIRAKAAVETDFTLTVIQLEPVYDLKTFEARAKELTATFPGFDPSHAAREIPRETHDVRVAFVADSGKGPSFKLPNRYNLFLRLDTFQSWLGRDGEVNLVKVSNPGGVESGADATPQVLPIVWTRLNVTKADHPGQAAIQALKVNDDKVFWLGHAKTVGKIFSIFLTFIGSFSVLAGLLLIINIFTMLAEERKAELGIARAVGLRRSHLTRLFTLEGAYYAVPAAFIGTLAGLGLAYGLIAGFNTFADRDRFPAIPFRLELVSLLLAFATGILLTLATVYLGARRAARLNVVRAIRNLEEPERAHGRVNLGAGLAFFGVGAVATVLGFWLGSFAWQILGPTVTTIGLALLLRRRYLRKRLYPPLALALLAYHTATLFLIKSYDSVEGNIFAPVRSVLMAITVVVLVVYAEAPARLLGRLLARIRPLRAVASLATSYPLHRKFRTGLTLAMFSVILLVVSLFSIFGLQFAPNPAKESGGYDLEATVQSPFNRLEEHGNDPALLASVERYNAVPYYLQFGGDLVEVDNETAAQFGPPRDVVYGIDEAFARDNGFTILRRDPAYASDADAYRAVARNDGLAIVAYPYANNDQGNDQAHKVGSVLAVHARGGLKTFRIIGIQEQVHFKGAFVSRGALDSMFANVDGLFLVKLKSGVDAKTAAQDFEAAYRDVGMDASAIRSKVLDDSQQFRQIFTLIQLFLSLGLIVGILSLGIVTARSIIERRQEIGMMRALGYRRRDVRRVFLVETITLVGAGVLIGAALAVLVSFGLWVAVVRDLHIPYAVPWLDLGIIAAIALVATTLGTLSPILRAARTPPAEALRYIE